MSQNNNNITNDNSSNVIKYNHGNIGEVTDILDTDNDGELNKMIWRSTVKKGLPTQTEKFPYPDAPMKLLSVGDAKIPASLYK